MPLVKSMGSSRIGAISFTSYFGPNVTEGLADIEKREAQLNNIACLGCVSAWKIDPVVRGIGMEYWVCRSFGEADLGRADETGLKEIELSSAVHLALDEFELGDLPLGLAVGPVRGDGCNHGGPIFDDAIGE